MTNPRNRDQKTYVVVFGANNNGSRAFCTFLAEHGYSIILIDIDQSLLNAAEKNLIKEFPKVSLMKIKMDEFEEGEALRITKHVNKLGDVIKGFVITKNVMFNEQNSKKFEDLNFDEIHKIMSVNNEMMVGLLNVFLKPLKRAEKPFIINLKNHKYESEDEMIYWDLIYYSTSRYSTMMLENIEKAEKKIKSINVTVNYNSLKKEEDKERLCMKTFNYLGI